MSIQMGKLCSVLIGQRFGETVRTVADDLFGSVSKTIPMIRQSTNLERKDIIKSLQVLIKFRFVKFTASTINDQMAEYSIIPSRVLLMLRYPSFLQFMRTRCNVVAAYIVLELLREGFATASEIIVQAVKKNSEEQNMEAIVEYRDKFVELVSLEYIARTPVPVSENEAVPKLEIDEGKLFVVPTIDLNVLNDLLNDKSVEIPDKDVYWGVNYDKFNQEFRDQLMISSLERRIDVNAGDCLKHMIALMYTRTTAWEPISAPISLAELRHAIEKKSLSVPLVKHLEEYLSMINSDTIGFISKESDVGGGQYRIQIKKVITELTWTCIEHVITEKFGSKAARIFRVVKLKKYIEQEDIQKEAMIPAKEAKLLIYKLMEENFLHIHTVRKAGGGGNGPAKSFYLFHVKLHQIVNMLLDNCYKAIFNAITRITDDETQNKRLRDKKQRLDVIVDEMESRGEPKELIIELQNDTLTPPEREILNKVNLRLGTLKNAMLAIDDTLFLLQMYVYYNTAK
ncbi:DNA-directed RNA polymerase III subunit RPC3 [Culicoides brevitarsis]|uniref:DNA-directed RNA polymerase III subunit RPC3 n=1 Tax=Culicoides brevitarsis TaxID=469753 RepID=UPI00307C88F0